jgi:hypothetical protein
MPYPSGHGCSSTVTDMSVRSVIETWGSAGEERAAAYPCDRLIQSPDGVLFRAIDVDAPAPLLFRWVCQLRAAPYSYDWIDNRGHRSPRHLTPGLDELIVGQRVLTIFRLASFEPGRSMTLESKTRQFGGMALTYVVHARGDDRSRLIAKLIHIAGRGPYGWLLRRVLPAADLVMMRKQFLTLKALAERDVAASE